MNELGKIAIISHDAGGAEILSSLVRRQNLQCAFVLDGPARKIFERKLGPLETITLEKAIQLADTVLCGTGWQSNLEFDAMKLARVMGKHSIAFLDHWINFRERFERSGETCIPDEIWVGDELALVMAKSIFPDMHIRLMENPYFQDIGEEFSLLEHQKKESLSVLYVCEPIRDPEAGYSEMDALRYFLSNISVLGDIQNILIRPHPSEEAGKYDWAKQEFALPIKIGGTQTLFEEIAKSDVVAGCQSMAMVVGLIARKRVISSNPPGGAPCVLPHKEIEHFRNILEA